MEEIKNNYVKEVKRIKSKISYYNPKIENKKIKIFEPIQQEIQDAYNIYKKAIKEYNKGVTNSTKTIELAEQNLQQKIYTNDAILNRHNRGYISYMIENNEYMKTYYQRLSGKRKKNNSANGIDEYQEVANIINKAYKKAGINKTFSKDDIYNLLYSGASESSKYEEIVEIISNNMAEFRYSIIKELRSLNALSDADYSIIMNLLGF